MDYVHTYPSELQAERVIWWMVVFCLVATVIFNVFNISVLALVAVAVTYFFFRFLRFVPIK